MMFSKAKIVLPKHPLKTWGSRPENGCLLQQPLSLVKWLLKAASQVILEIHAL